MPDFDALSRFIANVGILGGLVIGLLVAFYKLGSKLADAHVSALERTTKAVEETTDLVAKISEGQVKISEGQERLIDTMEHVCKSREGR